MTPKEKIKTMAEKYFLLHPHASHIGILQMCLEAFPDEDENEVETIVKEQQRFSKSE